LGHPKGPGPHGAQRKGPKGEDGAFPLIFIDGYPSINIIDGSMIFIDGYPSMNINGYPVL